MLGVSGRWVAHGRRSLCDTLTECFTCAEALKNDRPLPRVASVDDSQKARPINARSPSHARNITSRPLRGHRRPARCRDQLHDQFPATQPSLRQESSEDQRGPPPARCPKSPFDTPSKCSRRVSLGVGRAGVLMKRAKTTPTPTPTLTLPPSSSLPHPSDRDP